MEILILPSCELCTDCVPPISIYRKYGKDWLAHRAHRAHAEHRAHRAHAEHRAHRAMKLRSAVGYGTYTGYPLYSRALWTAHCTEHNHMQHSSVSKVQYSAGRIPSTRDSPPWRQSRSPRTGEGRRRLGVLGAGGGGVTRGGGSGCCGGAGGCGRGGGCGGGANAGHAGGDQVGNLQPTSLVPDGQLSIEACSDHV